MKLMILGPPGAGKGTIAAMIAEEHRIPTISTGDLLRNAVSEKTEFGQKAKGYMDRGAYVPDEIVVKLLMERLKEKDCRNGYILDGFPRTMAQVRELERKKIGIDIVLNFNASKEVIIDRLSTRLTCRECGAIYNIKNIPPKKPGICDKCRGILYQRDDQKPEAIRERLRVYDEQTKPLIDYYRKKGSLKDVDANPKDPKAIFNSAKYALNP
jgi:adenylate kinase